jgi:hypothetical protein
MLSSSQEQRLDQLTQKNARHFSDNGRALTPTESSEYKVLCDMLQIDVVNNGFNPALTLPTFASVRA